MADKQLRLSPSRMTKNIVIRVCYVNRDHGFYRSNKETTVVFKKLQQFSWLFRWTLKIPLFPNLCGFFLVKIPPLPPLFKLLRWLIGNEAVAVLSKVWLTPIKPRKLGVPEHSPAYLVLLCLRYSWGLQKVHGHIYCTICSQIPMHSSMR